MKKILALICACALLSGCSIIPKPVEFFQKKVKPFPEESAKLVELQKQAAYVAKRETQATVEAALRYNVDTNVIHRAEIAADMSDVVSTALGPPVNAPRPNVAEELRAAVGKLDVKIADYKDDIRDVEGKKIEGTGALQIPYFVYLGAFVVVAMILWHLAKLALTAASVANPAAAIGVGGMNVAASVAGKGVVQLVKGGKNFLKWVDEQIPDEKLKAKLVEAFTTSQKQAQDLDVRAIVDQVRK